IKALSTMLEHINSLDKKGLTQLYMKQLRKGRLSDRGGAGLGFIDIKRKTGKDLKYDFLPIDKDTSFFLLTSTVSRTI
ncbi:unnamed protein product, partial [marine sediment metagenome]